MTTRRFLRPPAAPWRGLIGRFGLFEPDSFAITRSSVEGGHVLLDADVLTERPVEGASRDRSLEAGPPPTGVRATAGLACAGQQPPLSCHEPQELALGRFSSAADAAPDRLA